MLNKKLLGSVSAPPAEFVDDVFSTYLYTGTGNDPLVINNGIDLAGKGGLLWLKKRSDATGHVLFDTARGVAPFIATNTTNAQTSVIPINSFNSNGFSLSANSGAYNALNDTYCSWTFRKQPKFFDIVTYTGNGVSGRTVAHNLGSTPGMMIVKRTDTTGAWQVYHRANTAAPETDYLVLNTTAATVDNINRWNDTLPTSSVFSLGTDATVNASGGTYVAYLFAHDAGGFGTTGTDNVISCGSYTTDVSGNATVNLGYEPQFVLSKVAGTQDNWHIWDQMRGFYATNQSAATLYPNLANVENSSGPAATVNATGFQVYGEFSNTQYIYMAIRRPMKPPTVGTQVFSPVARTGTGATTAVTSVGFPPDLVITKGISSGNEGITKDRLRGTNPTIRTTAPDAENSTNTSALLSYDMSGVTFGSDNTGTDTNAQTNNNGDTYVNWFFRRATGFFDIVCYTGTGANRTVAHNLGAVPELMIVKRRSATNPWAVYANNDNTDYLVLNTTAATVDAITYWNDTTPTSSVFSVGTNSAVNASASTYVAYLFASIAGVSKVGSYTGTGTTQVINCAFTTGARFVMVKATSTTGDWVVVDTARGLISGNDPFLELNTTTAEQTGQDILDPDSSGFVVNQTTESINASGVSYIFLAIA